MEEKWVRIIEGNSTFTLTDLEGLTFLDANEDGVDVKVNSTETQGTDGVMLGPTSFGPFPLVLRFFYRGVDTKDYKLMKQKLRGMLFRRTPFYIVHSDMPGKKYAVYCEDNAISDIAHKYGTFEITFTVYKGYSESLLTTDEMSLSNQTEWQFGNNMIAFDEVDNYHHRTKTFRIYNGSDDAIDPTLRHTLNITIHTNAPNGLKLRNRKTGDVFEYYGSLLYTDTFMLKGVYPVVNGKRVGRDTNNSWITLEKGFNDFIVTGERISDFDITFSFSFIYR